MKTMRFRNWLASIVALLCSASALAYDFSFYGIRYTIISEEEKTAAVTGFNPTELDSHIRIMSSLREDYDYNGDRVYTVTRIDDNAFAGNTRLNSVTIPYSISEIGVGVFSGCDNLSRITVDAKNERYHSDENNLAIIETETNTLVSGCNNTVIPDGIKCIGEEAFSGMRKLTSINIPNSVTSIKDGAFRDCSSLTSFEIPGGVTTIEDNVFNGCTKLESIKLHNNITSIGKYAFASCNGLTSFDIPENVEHIGAKAFKNCEGLTSVNLPDKLKSIEDEVFFYCTNLEAIDIPEMATSIGDSAFWGCTKLTKIDIPNNVTSIGRETFRFCDGLTLLEIPKNVTSIGESAFMQCRKLTSIKVDKGNTAYDSREDCNAIIDSKTGTLIAGCATTFVPDGVTKIGEYAFYGQQSLTSLELPNSVTHIGTSAFHYTGLSSITLSKSLKVIGVNAFNNCEFTSIELPSNIDSIGRFAFQSCSELISVVLPKNIGKIPYGMFDSCRALKTIVIPEGVETIESRAFWSCTSLETIEFPSTLQTIGRASFWGCEGVKQITSHAITPPTVEREAFELIDRLNCKLIVPEESVEAYMAANEWKWFYTADGIEGLEDESVVDVYNLQGVTVKKQVRMKDLQGTLPKGIYIINGKKIAVR